MKYLLIGIPCAGKTTLGKEAADVLNLPFYDIDEISEKKRSRPDSLFDLFHSGNKMLTAMKEAFFELAEKDEDAVVAISPPLIVDGNLYKILPKFGKLIHVERDLELAKKAAKAAPGFVMRSVKMNVEDEPEPDIYLSVEAVQKYATDLPVLRSIANFTVENTGSFEENVQKVVDIIKSIQNTENEKLLDTN